MKIQNASLLGTTKARADALAILEEGLSAIDTETVLQRLFSVKNGELIVGQTAYPLPKGRLVFFGVGKCAHAGARAIEAIVGDALTQGIALDVAPSPGFPQGKILYRSGTHPLPSDENIHATKEALDMLEELSQDDLAILLVSGGGSTLLCQPAGGMVAADEARVFETLTHGGATIQEINTVRRHLSKARGGGLAAAAHPARVVSLIFSDVPGDDLSAISSGPTVHDTTTADDARAVLKKYDVPLSDAFLIETPKHEDIFKNVVNVLALSNMTALSAMADKAQLLGYAPTIETRTFTGEARDAGRLILKTLREYKKPAAHFYGGETTVTIAGSYGKGGRNIELALGALDSVQEDEIVVAAASDGRDNTDAAGALCDTLTREKAAGASLDASAFLEAHDAYTFFKTTGDLVMTGPTGANVSDLIIALSL